MKAQVGDYIRYNDYDGRERVSEVVSVVEYEIGTDYTEWEYGLANGDYVTNSDITYEQVYLPSEMENE